MHYSKMYQKVNAQGTDFESPNQKELETRSKSTKIVNVQGSKWPKFQMRRVLNAQGNKCAGCVKYPAPRNTMVNLHTNLGALSAKEWKLEQKVPKS